MWRDVRSFDEVCGCGFYCSLQLLIYMEESDYESLYMDCVVNFQFVVYLIFQWCYYCFFILSFLLRKVICGFFRGSSWDWIQVGFREFLLR